MTTIETVTIKGFRAFRKEEVFTFGNFATIIAGPNGTGKTSFFDALLWATFGTVSRLGGSRDYVGAGDILRNRFCSSNEETSVSIVFATNQGRLELVRNFAEHKATLNSAGITLNEAYQILGLDAMDAMQSFQRSRMLCQEQIAEFVTSKPRERYEWLKAFSGILRLSAGESFLNDIDSAYSTAIGRAEQANSEMQKLDVQLGHLQRDITNLEEVSTRTLEFSEDDLLVEEAQLLSEIVASQFLKIYDNSISLSQIVPLLGSLQSKLTKQEDALRWMENSFPRIEQIRSTLAEIGATRKQNEERLALFNKRITNLEAAISRSELEQTRLQNIIDGVRTQHSELHGLLEAMLRHVAGDRCPVCKQEIAAPELREIIKAELSSGPPIPNDTVKQLEELQVKLTRLRNLVTKQEQREVQSRTFAINLGNQFEDLQGKILSFESRSEELKKVPGLEKPESLEEIKQLLSETQSRLEKIRDWSGRIGEIQSKRNLLGQTPLLQAKRATLQQDSNARALLASRHERFQKAANLLADAREAARNSQVAVVGKMLERYSPLVGEIYKRLRPHKVFTKFGMEVVPAYKEGELFLEGQTDDGLAARIQPYFSMTQRNAVALCIFLALNLSLGRERTTIYIDDPVHSMDDVNILSLADLLRALTEYRQIVVSSHDGRVFDLFCDKLRPTENKHDGVKAYWFESCGKNGPRISVVTPPNRSNPPTMDRLIASLLMSGTEEGSSPSS